jgi:ferritin-like metal-binding protein YciE
MQTAHDLFLHEMSDMLDAERRILDCLSQQNQESSNSTLQSAFRSHHKQTEGQIERLEQCFELIEEVAQETECAGIKGLWEEHETMIDEDPSPDILDVFNVAAAIKVERYEISSYELLINLAGLMKQSKVVRLLKHNLREEEQTLKKMSMLATKIKPENLDENEEEQDESSTEQFAENPARREGRPGPKIVKKSGPRRSSAA